MPSIMADLISLIETEIPEARQNLQDSNVNLEKVAGYCEANYFSAENKWAALEETKNYTTQSLASVAYQINTLAYNLLHMLDLQTTQLDEMKSQINHISQTVMIHKEKIARREIGILTTNKNTTRQHKILAPANQERPIKYIRKPIDYTVLDDVGHGIKSVGQRAKRIVQHPNPIINSSAAPTTKPPTPPQPIRGTLSRGTKEYRTPAPPIAPPQVPSNYAPNYPLGHPRAQENKRGYSTLPIGQSNHHVGAPPNMNHPQVGTVHPQQHHHNVPPPPPIELESLPDPPRHFFDTSVSDGFPPPPEEMRFAARINFSGAPSFRRRMGEPEWVPKNYIEKVVAIYDYSADKEDELSFSENSIIYVVKKNDDGWYEGVMDGMAGLFPGNYVEPCL